MPLAVLSIDLVAKLAGLQSGLDKAGQLAAKQAALVEARWGKVDSVFQTLGRTIGAAFAVGAIGAFINRAIDGLDALNDVADATGASIENISALEDVAVRTGTSVDTVSTALVKFNSVLKEADGKNAASQALKAIGLDAQALKQLDPAEALRQTAVALAGFADDGNKARIVQELFGKSVREVAPFLKDLAGQGALNASVTTAQAQAAEKFNQQIFALQKNALDAARAIAGPLLGSLSKVFSAIEAYGSAGAALADNFRFDRSSDIAGNLASTFKEIERAQGRLAKIGQIEQRPGVSEPVLKRYQVERAELQAQLDLLGRRERFLLGQAADPGGGDAELARRGRLRSLVLPELPDKPGRPDKPVRAAAAPKQQAEFVGPELSQGLKDAIQALEATDFAKVERLRQELQALLSIEAAGTGGAGTGEAIRKVGEELAKLDPAQAAASERQRRLNELLAATPSAQLRDAQADMLLLAEAFERGTISAEQFNEAAAKRLDLTASVEKLDKETDDFAKRAAENIQDELGDVLFDVFKGDFDNIGKGFADLILRMAAEAQAAQIGKALFGSSVGGEGSGLLGQVLGSVVGRFFGGGTASGAGAGAGTVSGGSGIRIAQAAEGIDRVPHDGFIAQLHKDEQVVPARYRDPGARASVVNNIRIVGAPADTRTTQNANATGGLDLEVRIGRIARQAVAGDIAEGGMVGKAAQQVFGLQRQAPSRR